MPVAVLAANSLLTPILGDKFDTLIGLGTLSAITARTAEDLLSSASSGALGIVAG